MSGSKSLCAAVDAEVSGVDVGPNSPRHQGCACISEVANHLREYNACLETTMFSVPERVVIRTIKIDPRKRGKTPPMLATFCPFCGERYAEDTGPLAALQRPVDDGVGRAPRPAPMPEARHSSAQNTDGSSSNG